MSRARRSQERVLEHLTELSGRPLGGGPDPAFRERLRDELAAARAAVAAPARSPHRAGSRSGNRARGGNRAANRPSHRRTRARRRSPASALVSFGLVTAMMLSAVVTYQSVPGDALYPLKRAAESTLVRLSTDDVVRGERELVSAKTRAEEVAQLLGSSEGGPLVGKTLKDMERSTRAGISRLRRAEPRSPKIDKFAEDQRNMVGPMLERLDGPQQDQAVGYLDYIEGLVAPR
ncbi:DUF5667 domain-containing protein [Nonomuraea sp. SBT364]|uniref:DUF5667 domain-containing protein n=1 Tax=Nonomuraea sp. SBT364 TaxID=1580530 RepID=UPI000ABC6ACF|nr:DUF5667 domain-containing protein [Nonomuraea sp. SBT364]